MMPGRTDWMARLSSGVSSWAMRGAAKPVLVVARKTLVMPFGTSPCPVRPDEQIEAGRRAVHLAELDETVGAQIDDLIDPEAIAEIGHLDDDRRDIERQRADAVDDVLVRTGDGAFFRIDVVGQHGEAVERAPRISGPCSSISLTA